MIRLLVGALLLVVPGGLAAADRCSSSYGPSWGLWYGVGWSSHHRHHRSGWGYGVSVPLVWHSPCRRVVEVRERVVVTVPAPAPSPAPVAADAEVVLTPEAVHGPVVDSWIERRPKVEPILVGGQRLYRSGWHETRWVRYRDGFSEPRP
jgi:hypothetical protein